MPIAENKSHIKVRRRRAWMMAVLTVLLAALLVVSIFGGNFLLTAQQGNAAVPLPALAVMSPSLAPRFLFSINGVARPLGVAVSPTGDRIYVTEGDGERETKLFDRGGRLLRALNPPGSEPASRTPVYVAVSSEGKVYVSDRRAGTVHIYSMAGEHLGQLSPPVGAEGAWAPLALNVDDQDRLLVTSVSPGRHSVVIFNPDGAFLQQFGREGAGEGELSYPNGVTTDRAGRILVADSNNGRVTIFDQAGNSLWSFGRGSGGSPLGLPRGLVVDDRNRAHVADTMNHNVLVFELGEREAKLLFTIGTQGIKDGQFAFPNGLAMDNSDRLYVADRENNRVQVWTY